MDKKEKPYLTSLSEPHPEPHPTTDLESYSLVTKLSFTSVRLQFDDCHLQQEQQQFMCHKKKCSAIDTRQI